MNFDNLLKKLKEDYLKELPEKILALESLIIDKNIIEIQSFFHKTKGSGYTYGWPQVSMVAELGEHLCKKITHNSSNQLSQENEWKLFYQKMNQIVKILKLIQENQNKNEIEIQSYLKEISK